MKAFWSWMSLFIALPAAAELAITEICPRPDALDPNGKESGWIELMNTGTETLNLKDYALIRFNRGKEDKAKNRFALTAKEVAPGERVIIYTSEAYDNSEVGSREEVEEVRNYTIGESNEEMIVFPKKVNPKNYPVIRLYKALMDDNGDHILDKKGKSQFTTLLETYLIPVDLEDNKSFGPVESTRTLEVSLAGGEQSYTYQIEGDENTYTTAGRLEGVRSIAPADLTDVVNGDITLDDDVTEANGIYDFSKVTTSMVGVQMSETATAQLTDQYTISLWFKMNTTNANFGSAEGIPLFECRPSNTENRSGVIVVLNPDGQLLLQPRNSAKNAVSYLTDNEKNYGDGEWHHLALTGGQKNGETLNLYVDGVNEISAILDRDVSFQASMPLMFGRVYDSNSWGLYTGILCGLRVYNRALNNEELDAVRFMSRDRNIALPLTATGVTYTQGEATTFPASLSGSNSAYLQASAVGETIDLWVKPSATEATDGKEATVLVDCRNGSQGQGFLLLCKSGATNTIADKELYIQQGSAPSNYPLGITLESEKWTHLTLTIDTQTENVPSVLYVNGRPAKTFDFTTYVSVNTTCRFGGTYDTANENKGWWKGFRGEMMSPGVYAGALTEKQVATLHNSHALIEHVSQVHLAIIPENIIGPVYMGDSLKPLTVTATVSLDEVREGDQLLLRTTELKGTLTATLGETSLEVDKPIASPEAGTYTLTCTLTPSADAAVLAFELVRLRANAEGYQRGIFSSLTMGTANPTEGNIAYGPQIGPTIGTPYEDFGIHLSSPMAKIGEPFTVKFEMTPFMTPTGDKDKETLLDGHKFTKVELLYRTDADETITAVEMSAISADDSDAIVKEYEDEDDDGNEITVTEYYGGYVGTIPAEVFTEAMAGQRIRFKARITDGAGNVWLSPSFHNPDDTIEWYGTIVEPREDQVSATLDTFHLFADNKTDLEDMDKQYDTVAGRNPNGARVGIYDSQTNTYYDNVRIDLRGNTSAHFHKKSHGLRFNKCQPLVCENPFWEVPNKKGKLKPEKIETRKTSFTSEFADPTYIRQSLSFWLWRSVGNKVPFHYPVRLQLNGEFYQLAFHSNRFTDELIEDYYELNPLGYGYKNVGQIASSVGTTAGSVEKKTPDDGDETSAEAKEPLRLLGVSVAASDNYTSDKENNNRPTGDLSEEDATNLTNTVYDTFDIPAWINYLAAARITQEADDVWANICVYWDCYSYNKHTDGSKNGGNDTWMPLAYDHNLSWGAWFYNDDTTKGHCGLKATDDTFKSHPFYGGRKINAHRANGTLVKKGNYAVEAILQNPTFRQMLLRRLRTMMDEQLMAPGTTQADTPFWSYVTKFKDAVQADAELDRAKWGTSYASTVIYVWDHILEWDEAFEDLWDNYVVPRRTHLFVTHAAKNATDDFPIGYAYNESAGIPEAQTATFEPLVMEKDVANKAMKIINPNDEAIDLSGWTLKGYINATLPPGTVIAKGMPLVVTTDRRTYVENNAPCYLIGLATYNPDWEVSVNPSVDEKATIQILAKDRNTPGALNLTGTSLSEDAQKWIHARIQAKQLTVADIMELAEDDLAMGYRLNETPIASMAEATELNVAGISFDDQGNVLLTVTLAINGNAKTGTLNVPIKVKTAETLEALASATDEEVNLDAFTDGKTEMPTPSTARGTSPTSAFYQLFIK